MFVRSVTEHITEHSLIYLFVFFLVISALSVAHALLLAEYSHIPGPIPCKISRHWVVLFDLRRERPQKVAEWHTKYGPIVLIAPGEVSIADPAAMREIYSSSGRHDKSNYFDHFITHNERSMFAEKAYEQHRQKRRLTSSFFQATSVQKPAIELPMRRRVVAVLDQVKKSLEAGVDTINIFPLLNHYAWDNTVRLVYGPRHSTRTVEEDCYERSILLGLKQTEWWSPLRNNLPVVHQLFRSVGALVTQSSTFLSAEHDLSCWSGQKLQDASRDPAITSDHSLLRRLSEAKAADGTPLSPNYIECEVLDNLHAAQATVTVALTYVIYHLSAHPSWQARIRQELASLAREDDDFPSFSTLAFAPILDACIRESYRLNPVSSGRAERVVPAGKHYAGVYIPAETLASASTIALHRLPTAFANPQRFDPARWLDASPEQLRVQEAAFIPFGYGARICLGKAYAQLEVKLLTAALLLRYAVSPVPGATERQMEQAGTQDALPRGLRCDVQFRKLC